MSRAGSAGEAGFTLLELLVVLAVIAAVAVIALPGFERAAPRLETRAVAQVLAADLRRLRSEAVMRGEETRLVVEREAQRYVAIPAPGARKLPPDLVLAYMSPLSGAGAPLHQHLRFRPDGSSTGGSVDLSRAGKTWRVDVDWLTGRVALEEKP